MGRTTREGTTGGLAANLAKAWRVEAGALLWAGHIVGCECSVGASIVWPRLVAVYTQLFPAPPTSYTHKQCSHTTTNTHARMHSAVYARAGGGGGGGVATDDEARDPGENRLTASSLASAAASTMRVTAFLP